VQGPRPSEVSSGLREPVPGPTPAGRSISWEQVTGPLRSLFRGDSGRSFLSNRLRHALTSRHAESEDVAGKGGLETRP
jgi:hypothetical protein